MSKIVMCLLSVFMLIMNVEPVPAYNDICEKSVIRYEIIVEDNLRYIQDSDGNRYTNFFNGLGEEVSLETALIILNKNFSEEETSEPILRDPVPWILPNSVSVNSSNLNYVGNEIKVTPDAIGPATITYGGSESISDSFSISIGESAKTTIISYLEVKFDVTWTHTVNTLRSYTIAYDIPAGQTGAVYFKPYYRRFSITYYDGNYHPYNMVVVSPIKLSNGFADDLFYLKSEEF